MKDEIKEILEKPNVYSFNDECYLYFGDYNKLKDYITNLQEEKIQLEGKIKQLEHNCKQASDSCRQHRLASKNHIRRLERREQQINVYKSRNEKANALLDEMLERAYIDGEYIMYDYSTNELLEVKQALQGEDKE